MEFTVTPSLAIDVLTAQGNPIQRPRTGGDSPSQLCNHLSMPRVLLGVYPTAGSEMVDAASYPQVY